MASTSSDERYFAVRLGPRTLLDAAVAAAAFGGTLAQLRHGGFAPLRTAGGLDPGGMALAACSTLPVLAWRRYPSGVFVATALAGVAMAGSGYAVDLLVGPTVALYLLVASRGRQVTWTARITATVLGLLGAYLVAAGLAHRTVPGFELLHTGLAWAVAWFAGERTRLRREQLAEYRRRAVRAERDAERERLLAVAEERARIARDLHDSAGHAISLIAVRAGAARLRRDPARSLATLREIEDLARSTAGEIDRTIASLREGAPGDVEAPAGLASLGTLVGRHAATGHAVTLDTTGAPRPLAPATDQAAYRILQEALTNAARHGAGGTRVEIGYDEGAVALTVTNQVTAGSDTRPGGGHGLIGMRERATLLGGSFDAGCVDGVFRVRARLPDGAP